MKEKEEKQISIERSIIKRFRKEIWHPFVQALKLYRMIEPGDRIAVCISGGKDSFLLAKCMQEIQAHGDMEFELKFLVMDPGYRKENRALIEQNAQLMGIPVTVLQSDIFDSVVKIDSSPCYLCARMRRGFLYAKAKELGCTKIALGHHMDDAAETVLLSVLYAGQFNTMMPKLHSENFPGMELIRPLYFVRERDVIAWRDFNELKFLRCACRFTEKIEEERLVGEEEKTSKRAEVKELIARLEQFNPTVAQNLLKSAENVNLDACLGYVSGGKRFSFLDTYGDGTAASHGVRADVPAGPRKKEADGTEAADRKNADPYLPDSEAAGAGPAGRKKAGGRTAGRKKAAKKTAGKRYRELLKNYPVVYEPSFVYLLRCADGTYYCGYSNDIEKRLAAHNAGRGAKYTKARRPVELVYSERFETKGDALRREYAVKQLTRAGKEALVRTAAGKTEAELLHPAAGAAASAWNAEPQAAVKRKAAAKRKTAAQPKTVAKRKTAAKPKTAVKPKAAVKAARQEAMKQAHRLPETETRKAAATKATAKKAAAMKATAKKVPVKKAAVKKAAGKKL